MVHLKSSKQVHQKTTRKANIIRTFFFPVVEKNIIRIIQSITLLSFLPKKKKKYFTLMLEDRVINLPIVCERNTSLFLIKPSSFF